ncbi:hypothetical protein [Polyangium sorediatum]|uniref:Uncharacterized protein n=1 Tax=Polyangium sorediatum TaxID=889274 RepID=A0ABT6NM23_9BACT|nr:hypothetical protein [Polyangium sorediatum]MDI1429374.1 hypothetical protein [Polyangium sorediatum]
MSRMALLTRFAPLTLGASLFVAGTAYAQPSEDGFDKDAEDTMAGKANDKEEAAAGDKMPGEKEKKKEDSGDAGIWDTKEDPTKAYRYVGLRYRHAIIPKAILNLFTDGGATVGVPMGGLEFGTRRDRLEYIFSLSYADYSKGEMLFKGKGQPVTAYERVQSDLAVIYGKVEILYEVPLDSRSRFSLLFGGGVGIGGVIGDLHRRQVYPGSGSDPGVPSQWNDCTAFGEPDATYCDVDNGHFGDYAEPSWASGGSKPFIFPWIAVPQVSFRYKPIKMLQARADVGFAISSGVYFGASIDYIL